MYELPASGFNLVEYVSAIIAWLGPPIGVAVGFQMSFNVVLLGVKWFGRALG